MQRNKIEHGAHLANRWPKTDEDYTVKNALSTRTSGFSAKGLQPLKNGRGTDHSSERSMPEDARVRPKMAPVNRNGASDRLPKTRSHSAAGVKPGIQLFSFLYPIIL
jgi:hypothetical protein